MKPSRRAATGEFDDYAEPSDASHICPITQLHAELTAAGFTQFAKRVASGEFDATTEESEEWARSQTDVKTIRIMAAMSEPRAYTKEEARQHILDHVRWIVQHWATLEVGPHIEPLTIESRCDGVAFSILAMLDGVACTVPGVDMTLGVHPDDEADCRENGQNWYVPGMAIDGMLHEHFYAKEGQG